MDFISDAFRILLIVLEVVLIFNVVIIVHEVGHFLAGRWRGLKIDKFQIWFGKPLWKKKFNGVQYGLGCIPAGGFVALPQMAPMEVIEGESEDGGAAALPPISPMDKIIVAAAGPLFSLGLAFVFAAAVWAIGKPESESVVTRTIGWVEPGSPAAESGLQRGDEIISVDNKPVRFFHGMIDSVNWNVISSEGDTIPFVVERGGEETTIDVDMSDFDSAKAAENLTWYQKLFARPELRKVGIAGKHTPMVAEIAPHSPAAEAGMKANDLILELDGEPVLSLFQVGAYTRENSDRPIVFTVEREEKKLDLTITPRIPDNPPEGAEPRPIVGIMRWDEKGARKLAHPSPWQQVGDALRGMKSTLAAVFSPKSDVKASHLSGPLGIMRVYYSLFQHPDGWRLVLWFSVILNVNLAVLNMLPFPVLDGGHITMALIEAVRRRPLSLRVLEYVQFACVMLLFGFIIFVTMKDAGDIFGGGGGGEPGEKPLFEPPASPSPALAE